MKHAYFVTGTDTNAGKTYVSTLLIRHFVAKGLRVVGMKPIASGCHLSVDGAWQGQYVNDDALDLAAASNVKAPLDLVNPYRFLPAIAPHIAADQAGVAIDLEKVRFCYDALANEAEVVLVEGAGGFLVPLSADKTMADLVSVLKLPMILVVGMRLGCINHALLTVEAIRARGLTLAGWVANQVDPAMEVYAENLETLRQRIHAPCLGVVAWGESHADFNL